MRGYTSSLHIMKSKDLTGEKRGYSLICVSPVCDYNIEIRSDTGLPVQSIIMGLYEPERVRKELERTYRRLLQPKFRHHTFQSTCRVPQLS